MRSALENASTHAPIGMALVDMAGRFLAVNDAMCRMSVTASVPIALFDDRTDLEILAAAESAMYGAKDAGRDPCRRCLAGGNGREHLCGS